MKANPYNIVAQLEMELEDYTGFRNAITVNSCTNALFLALRLRIKEKALKEGDSVTIPKYTYVGVPFAIKAAGLKPIFTDNDWSGYYELGNTKIFDSAKYLSHYMSRNFHDDSIVCLSHHYSKPLSCGQGGTLLHNNYKLNDWLKATRFDGRTPGYSVHEDQFTITKEAYHFPMQIENAALGLANMMHLPDSCSEFSSPSTHYRDLTTLGVFK